MAAPYRQDRNTRRHLPGKRVAAEKQEARRPGASIGRLRCGAPEEEKAVPCQRAGWLRCRGPAGACTCGMAARRRLTPEGSRIGSSSENARKFEGFDAPRGPSSGTRGQRAVSEQTWRPGPPGGLTGGLHAVSSSRLAVPGEAARAWRAGTAGEAARNARAARASGRTPLAMTCLRQVGRRGTGLAVIFSRVRFRLGDSPGIEEKAG